MAKILVIADDFTGALDTGVQFASAGASVYVTTAETLLAGAFDSRRSICGTCGAASKEPIATINRMERCGARDITVNWTLLHEEAGKCAQITDVSIPAGIKRARETIDNAPQAAWKTCQSAAQVCDTANTSLCGANADFQADRRMLGKGSKTDGCKDSSNNGCLYAKFLLTSNRQLNFYDVYVADTESRHAEPARAAHLVYELTAAALKQGFTYLYKKTDSALRGNVGAELGAMLSAGGDSAAGGGDDAVGGGDDIGGGDTYGDAVGGGDTSGECVPSGGATLAFAPAYPKNGRVTIGGVHYIDGTPVGESVFAHDPFTPVKHSEVSRIVKDQTEFAVVNYPSYIYKSTEREKCGADPGADGEASGESVSNASDSETVSNASDYESVDYVSDCGAVGGAADTKSNRVIEIYDAESDSDLLYLAKYLKNHNKLKLLAGCAGFAGALPAIYGIGKFARPEAPPRSGSYTDERNPACKLKNAPSRNILLVTGSVNPITLKQLSGAEKAGFFTIILSPEQKIDPSANATERLTEAVAAALKDYGRVVIAAAASPAEIENTDEYARSRKIDTKGLRGRICANIGRLTASILEKCKIDALAVFGGDTLYEILKAADIPAISPLREIAPGIVEAQILSERHNMRLITKSGGFGGENALGAITDYLESEKK